MIGFLGNSIEFGPVNFDDKEMIKNNPDIERPVEKEPEESLAQEVE